MERGPLISRQRRVGQAPPSRLTGGPRRPPLAELLEHHGQLQVCTGVVRPLGDCLPQLGHGPRAGPLGGVPVVAGRVGVPGVGQPGQPEAAVQVGAVAVAGLFRQRHQPGVAVRQPRRECRAGVGRHPLELAPGRRVAGAVQRFGQSGTHQHVVRVDPQVSPQVRHRGGEVVPVEAIGRPAEGGVGRVDEQHKQHRQHGGSIDDPGGPG